MAKKYTHTQCFAHFGTSPRNVNWSWSARNGKVSVIIAIAKDKAARPRSIAECFPSKMQLKVTHCDPSDGSFGFEAEGLSSR
jgi:hypothetical protein